MGQFLKINKSKHLHFPTPHFSPPSSSFSHTHPLLVVSLKNPNTLKHYVQCDTVSWCGKVIFEICLTLKLASYGDKIQNMDPAYRWQQHHLVFSTGRALPIGHDTTTFLI